MTSLSWSERNTGRHGILLTSEHNHLQNPPNEIFFPSRIKMYLDLLDCLPLSDSWIKSLPQIDTQVTVPSVGPDCPICYFPYLQTANDESPTATDDSDPKEIPVRLPCGHILCEKCVRHLAKDANASTGVVCPFCRAGFDHMPITTAGSWDMLLKCMWVTLEIFARVSDEKDDEQDMEAVVGWAQDFPRLSLDVPPADKRDAIQSAVQTWIGMGDKNFCRELVVTVLGPRAQVTPPVVRLGGARRCALQRRRASSTTGRPTGLLINHTGDMRMSRSQDFQAADD